MKCIMIVLFLACAANAQSDTIWVVLQKLGLNTTAALAEVAGFKAPLDGYDTRTLFAPSEAAFALLPKDVVHRALTDRSFAQEVGCNHAVDSVVMSSDLTNNQLLQADHYSGPRRTFRVNIYSEHGTTVITVNGAPVSSPDHVASNGVVHVIDQVMYPVPTGSVVDVITGNASLSTLATAVSKASLVATLSGTGPFTVFAPTNEAFAKLPAGVLDGLLKNVTALTDVLTYHVVPGVYYDAGLYNGQMLKTVEGKEVTVKTSASSSLMVNDATILTHMSAFNGVVQVIDTVLIPPSMHFELVYNKE